jgi:hypothetical protein
MMTRLIQKVGFTSIFLTVLTGCVTNIDAPVTRDDFIAAMKPGGLFRNVETVTVNRPSKTVVANVTEYANRCLKTRTTRKPSYAYKEAGGSTTYLPKIAKTKNSVTALSVQEQYNDRPQSGAPPGGIFTLAAEIRPAGKSKTQVDVYYITGRGKIADWLKRWSDGDKRTCPSLD